MSKLNRTSNVIIGILMVIFGLLLINDPENGLYVVANVIALTFTIRGLQSMLYYFSMARYMVGGKTSLYRGIIWLDAGILAGSLSDNLNIYIIMYITVLHFFSGMIDMLRARESKALGSPSWKSQAVNGATNILVAMAVAAGGIATHSAKLAVYVYAAGLIYSACVRIIGAFRKTAIVYIQ